MTVISRYQQSCCNYNSCSNSDTESLNLGSAAASDTESLQNEPVSRTRRNPLRVLAFKEDSVSPKRTSGRKKTRRYLNGCVLQTLAEEDEEEEIPTLLESYKSPFARLLEDENALEFWNDFIEKSQNEQTVIMASLGQKQEKSKNAVAKTGSPFARISAKIKRTIKMRNKLAKELLSGLEKDMINFFKDSPDSVYVKEPSNSFERLLLHAIAQYHSLHSISVFTDTSKVVEVQNDIQNWSPADTCLCDVIAIKN